MNIDQVSLKDVTSIENSIKVRMPKTGLEGAYYG